jgi:predicted Ser/Thr protein kinase/uncharacterized RDD family membrane protein YckC
VAINDAKDPALDQTALPSEVPAPRVASVTAVDEEAQKRKAAAAMIRPPLTPMQTPQLAVGTMLAHFRIEGLLGQGGMGEVYQATDTSLERTVALKVLPTQFADNAQRRQRLMREARAQAKVTHSNVCHIYFVGEQDARLFFAMEYVEGKTFADLCAAKPMAINDALELVRSAAQGLDAALSRGFLHRDVKPSNLMVTGDGTVKVLDFGLVTGDAEAFAAPGANGPRRVVPVDLTQTHAVGTPLYMAPEQGRGESIDLRADIYALGATLFELITGRPPFNAPTAAMLLSMHTEATRPVLGRTIGPARMTSPIDALIAKMMASNPVDRFASYAELITEIDRVSTVRTRVAGFGVRFTTVVMDLFVILAMMAIPIAVVAEAGYSININGEFFFLFAAYKFVMTGKWGATLGERMMELKVISTASYQRPSWGQALKRTLILAGPLMLTSTINWIIPWLSSSDVVGNLSGIAVVIAAGVTFLHLIFSALRSAGKRTAWDRGSRTMIVYR